MGQQNSCKTLIGVHSTMNLMQDLATITCQACIMFNSFMQIIYEFQNSNDVVEKLDKKKPSAIRQVDHLKGNSVSCGEVSYMFEFIPYKFKEPPRAQNDKNAARSDEDFPQTQSNGSCEGTLVPLI